MNHQKFSCAHTYSTETSKRDCIHTHTETGTTQPQFVFSVAQGGRDDFFFSPLSYYTPTNT